MSESSLKRWVDAGKITAARTDGGHRRIELSEAMRFIRDTGTPLARPELLDLPDVATAREHGDRLLDMLLDGDLPAARGWLVARYLEGSTIAELADGPIRAAMHAVGELWHHEDGGIFIEHRATAVCVQAVAQLRSMIDAAGPSAPLALGGAPAGDPYLLPAQLAAMVVEEVGLRAMNLGADTPLSAFEHAVAANTPKLLWLSISSALAPARARSYVRWLESLPATMTIVVGGQASSSLTNLPPHVRRANGMQDLADAAAALVKRRGRSRDAAPVR